MSILGPSAANITTTTADAEFGAFPLVLITGQKPIKSSNRGQFRIVDIVDLFGLITKLAQQIPIGDLILAMDVCASTNTLTPKEHSGNYGEAAWQLVCDDSS